MVAFSDMARHPGRTLSRSSRHLMEAVSPPPKRYSILGLVLLAIGVYAAISLFPEARRYLHIERM